MPTTVLGEGASPEKAIEYWKSKIPLSSKEAEKLAKEVKERAFYVAGLAKLDQVNLIYNALLEALRNGHSVETFKKNIAGLVKDKGWDSRRIETIFHTNMQTAYQAGRWKAIERNKKSLPYLQYSSVLDNRTRPSHAVLHGLVFPVDHEFWGSHYPPNGFNCRCTAIQLSRYQTEKRGLEIQKEIPKSLKYTDTQRDVEISVIPKPDPGFEGNVGKDWLKTLESPLFDKLENTETNLAKTFVSGLVKEHFQSWRKEPNIDFPIAILNPENIKMLQSKSKIVRLSKDTMIKQDNHHPELTFGDYLKIQEAINSNNYFLQDENNAVFVWEDNSNGIVCIIKTTKSKKAVFLTSMRRLSSVEAKRDEELKRLRKRK